LTLATLDEKLKKLREISRDAFWEIEDQNIAAVRSGRNYFLKVTCTSCPEQYDVFLEKELVAYLRLRHGEFRADCPDHDGATVYTAAPVGDGCFEDTERLPQLTAAIQEVDKWVSQQNGYTEYEAANTAAVVIQRLSRLHALALEALGDEAAATRFLLSDHPELDGQSPYEAAQTDLGGRSVEELLSRALHR